MTQCAISYEHTGISYYRSFAGYDLMLCRREKKIEQRAKAKLKDVASITNT